MDTSQVLLWRMIERGLLNKRIEDAPYIQKVHMLLTSRPTGLAKQIGLLTNEIEIEREDVDPDIKKYVKFRVERMTSAQLIPDDVSTLTSRFLHERAEGMFLWVSLILDQLENYEDSLSFHDVLDRFKNVPPDIQGLYHRALKRIMGKESLYSRAARIFSILLCSAQPLTTNAFALAMTELPESCTSHQELIRRSDLRFEYTCKNACGTLIRIVDNTIQICHPTAREFLLHESLYQGLNGIDQPAGHALLAEMCLRYLMLEDVEIPQGDEQSDAQRYPLLAYALAYWPLHVRSSSDRIHTYKETIRRFFSLSNITRLHSCLRPSEYWNTWFPNDSLSEDLVLHVIVYFDMKNLLQNSRLEAGGDSLGTMGLIAPGDEMIHNLNTTVEARDSKGNTALHLAIYQGLPEMVNSLLQRGADPNATNCEGMNALHRAAQGDDIDVLKTVLELTDDIEVQMSDGETPLLLATDFGIIQALLDNGANINARRQTDGCTKLHFATRDASEQVKHLCSQLQYAVLLPKGDWNPLHAASFNGSAECITLLLGYDIWLGDKTKRGETAMHLAAYGGHYEACKLLLEAGCGIDDQAEDGYTPLVIAAEEGHESIVNLLLAEGASVNTIPSTSVTALSTAAANGHAKVVRLLLDHGADKNFVTAEKRPMLLAAIDRGHRDVVKLLIESGINLESQWKSWTPLYLAIVKDDIATVNQLLDKGADIHCRGPKGFTILHDAIRHGRHELVYRLLDLGLDVTACTHKSWTVLHEAASVGRLDIAARLIKGGALVNTSSATGWTPLHVCCEKGHVDLLNLLLREQANPLSRTKFGSSPLDLAAYNGHLQAVDRIIQELHEQQVPVEIWNTALGQAAAKGHLEVLKRLLQEGLDIEFKDRDGSTPLMRAISNNQQPVTSFLISQGANIHTTNNRGFTVLHEGARYGMASLVMRLLAQGLDPLSPTFAGVTPLALAAHAGHLNVVRSLLSHQPNTIQDHGLGADIVHYACGSDHPVILDLLLQAGHDVHTLDSLGRSTVFVAAHHGHNDVLNWLLARNVDASRLDRWGYSPLHEAAGSGYEDIVASLIHHGVPIDPISEYGTTPLLEAVVRRHVKCIDLLINAGGDPTITDLFGRSALDTAATSPSLLARMGNWSQSLEPTDPILLKVTQERAMRSLFQKIHISDAYNFPEIVGNLTRGLILLKEYELARVGILILTRPLSEQLIVWNYVCNACRKDIDAASATLRICQTCTIDLCESCFGRYEDERQPEDCLCEGHEFLTVSEDDWNEMEPKYEYGEEKITIIREAWLSNMRQRFPPLSPTELDPS
ncbi:Ankyrin repeat-containing protein [Cladophialophora immunda]|nr:Ankyrin repeat-containing protein [Cladophialophora immunda]